MEHQKKFMAEIRGEGWPKIPGYSAHTNCPGRIDDREYPQTASFMKNLSLASCQFTVGSAVLLKNTKKTQPVNLEDIPITCGTPNHTCPLDDADLLGKARRAEYDRRAAYDTRVELARREEYDKRLEYDRRNQIALSSTRDTLCVDWKEQVD